MSRFAVIAGGLAVAWGLVGAAPAPQGPPASALVAKLGDPSKEVRAAAVVALKDRVDALPWLRRAARATDKDTAKRAADLLAPSEKKRQEAVAKVIDGCIRDGHIDLFMEWHHYWQPEKKEELWSVGPRAAKAGMDLFAKSCPELAKDLERRNAPAYKNTYFHDGPESGLKRPRTGNWHLRTDRMSGGPNQVAFAYVAGPVQFLYGSTIGGHYFALGSFQADRPIAMFIACDGEVQGGNSESEARGVRAGLCVIVCRGNFRGNTVGNSVVLVDGDVDLEGEGKEIQGSLIRASGAIRLRPNAAPPVNCTIEAHAKNATAPYTFFELADVGLSLADDEEGLVVTAVKPGTPFGDCGIEKGDLVRAIDDAPAGHSEEFRKKVRRALVRQGDCLLTVTRGTETHDVPVFFPLPK